MMACGGFFRVGITGAFSCRPVFPVARCLRASSPALLAVCVPRCQRSASCRHAAGGSVGAKEFMTQPKALAGFFRRLPAPFIGRLRPAVSGCRFFATMRANVPLFTISPERHDVWQQSSETVHRRCRLPGRAGRRADGQPGGCRGGTAQGGQGAFCRGGEVRGCCRQGSSCFHGSGGWRWRGSRGWHGNSDRRGCWYHCRGRGCAAWRRLSAGGAGCGGFPGQKRPGASPGNAVSQPPVRHRFWHLPCLGQ